MQVQALCSTCGLVTARAMRACELGSAPVEREYAALMTAAAATFAVAAAADDSLGSISFSSSASSSTALSSCS